MPPFVYSESQKSLCKRLGRHGPSRGVARSGCIEKYSRFARALRANPWRSHPSLRNSF